VGFNCNQAILNLVVNAIEAMSGSERSAARIAASTEGAERLLLAT
jgi:C4-dicarboxylate-specific signal transduction histidine kinase